MADTNESETLKFNLSTPQILYLTFVIVHYRFDTQLQDVLDPQHASIESRMDSRVQSKL